MVSKEMVIVLRELIHDTVDVDTMRNDLASNSFRQAGPVKGINFLRDQTFVQTFLPAV